MNILITGASTRIATLLAEALDESHSVTLSDRVAVSDADSFVLCDLDHDEATNDLVRGMDVVIHPGQVDGELPVSEQLDAAMRCVYNLVRAAAEEGVPRFVFLSSLSVMGRYDEEYAVTERWLPAPTTETDVLCFHLGEFICREFAREHKIEVVCLRLGDLAEEDGAPAATSTLYPSDAVQAVEKALTADISEGYAGSRSYWSVFHIQSDVPNRRFLTTTAETRLGFSPSS
ncbi:MAG: NAD(P)-dependent oxidoreductase [Dehalococcoidia bacterium]|nr:NAD(P)-dependent oxidoreductase [Dehalococcoidia bacterium]